MIRGSAIARAALTLACMARAAGAQTGGVALAVGSALPNGGFTTSAASGYDISFHLTTSPIISVLALRVDVDYAHFAGAGSVSSATVTGSAIGLTANIGPNFYVAAAPGFWNSSVNETISGTPVQARNSYFGLQGLAGFEFAILGHEGFVESGIIKLSSGVFPIAWIPIRLGVRL